MPESRPSKLPPETLAGTSESGKGTAKPTLSPPGATEGEGVFGGESRPRDLSASELAVSVSFIQEGAAPTLKLPEPSAVQSGGITAWVSDKRVNALFGINQNRNSWVGIAGVGWKKLANNSDSAVVALTILAAHAKQMQTSYNYREEADGMIHECYVW